jgi:hypothetical protein
LPVGVGAIVFFLYRAQFKADKQRTPAHFNHSAEDLGFAFALFACATA